MWCICYQTQDDCFSGSWASPASGARCRVGVCSTPRTPRWDDTLGEYGCHVSTVTWVVLWMSEYQLHNLPISSCVNNNENPSAFFDVASLSTCKWGQIEFTIAVILGIDLRVCMLAYICVHVWNSHVLNSELRFQLMLVTDTFYLVHRHFDMNSWCLEIVNTCTQTTYIYVYNTFYHFLKHYCMLALVFQ